MSNYKKSSKKSPDCNLKEATVLKEKMQETVKKKEDSSARPKCKLDSNGCLNLQDILLMFDSPISQERAWALCYQIVKGLSRLTENKFYEISELWQIVLHKHGDICLESLAGEFFTVKFTINSEIIYYYFKVENNWQNNLCYRIQAISCFRRKGK